MSLPAVECRILTKRLISCSHLRTKSFCSPYQNTTQYTQFIIYPVHWLSSWNLTHVDRAFLKSWFHKSGNNVLTSAAPGQVYPKTEPILLHGSSATAGAASMAVEVPITPSLVGKNLKVRVPKVVLDIPPELERWVQRLQRSF